MSYFSEPRTVIGFVDQGDAAAATPHTRPVELAPGVIAGGTRLTIIAGPCAIEDEEQLQAVARAVKAAGAHVLRGGAFKPRTSPHTFQGLGAAGLALLQDAGRAVGLPTITEVMAHTDVELVARYADVLQIGTRSMHNIPLLHAAGECDRPVLLKRGFMATVDEWLLAAEHIMSRGNTRVVLCERGIRSFDTGTRFTLDINAVALAHALSDLPVIVDPSHSTGRADLVAPAARAGVAAGADGLIVEVHPNPAEALSDGYQSLSPEEFHGLMRSVRRVAAAVDRTV